MTRRRFLFLSYLTGQSKLAIPQLIATIRERRYPALMREAALRWLMHWSPLEFIPVVTPLERRRLVRQHYGV